MNIEEFKELLEKQYMTIDWKVVYPKLYEKQHFVGTRNDIEIKLYEHIDGYCEVDIKGTRIKFPKEIYQKISNTVDEQNNKRTEMLMSEFWK